MFNRHPAHEIPDSPARSAGMDRLLQGIQNEACSG